MPEKGGVLSPATSQVTILRPSPLHQWRFGALTALVFFLMVVVWSIDGCTIKGFIEPWRWNSYSMRVDASSSSNVTKNHHLQDPTFNTTHHQNLTSDTAHSRKPEPGTTRQQNLPSNLNRGQLKWVSAELEPNFTANLLGKWLAPGGEPCREARTVEISVPSIDGRDSVELTTGEIHEFYFQALDDSGKPVCIGGDYFETDLSGENWKSRPLVKDFGNGTYSVSLQVHPDFAGDYNLTVILLFRHFEGLKFSPTRFAFDKTLRNIRIRFAKADVTLPELRACEASDFTRDAWSGRWTRHGKNDDCQISNDGRYRCLPADFACRKPWCDGALGALESNGWVYSSHCSFKLFSGDSAWECLKNRWIFFWGDSNHVDSIRNLLNFVLGLPDIHAVPRRFDMNFTNPKNESQTVRITSIFNGHWNESQNYLGLDSLKDQGFRDLLNKYFSEATAPDAMIVNSGLHDGVHWSNLRAFVKGAEYAAKFWREAFDSVTSRGLKPPKVIFRNTIATGGYARSLAFNPSKMEAFNGVLLEKMRREMLVQRVVDNFDMTYPWHYDNRCNDGVHYGRAPAKMRWRDGEIGHQYFVDLMLVHVLMNALCVR
ncbi:PREDICTED: uncharacterized protein LOC104802744 [Tarenaya hassleriana]|uniref:uncharacterized protein LOC104802744 n=1 Tax=Tarenaya hassleriana TaxID=28532 RepID=UPI00053C75A5|nr:PREDICTED: uncharacterized protein LOC104802744 [Tarenaya hassleriana]XP_010524791.1 PREDICTED: uncharacterized protein LOC104802744 [Tarenaya hassleriana]